MQSSKLSRRSFLRWTALTGAAAFVAACQPQAPTKPAETADPAGQPTAGAAEPTAAASLMGNPHRLDLRPVTMMRWTFTSRSRPSSTRTIRTSRSRWMSNPGMGREKLYAAAAAGQPPDIWWADSDTLITYAAKGVWRCR